MSSLHTAISATVPQVIKLSFSHLPLFPLTFWYPLPHLLITPLPEFLYDLLFFSDVNSRRYLCKNLFLDVRHRIFKNAGPLSGNKLPWCQFFSRYDGRGQYQHTSLFRIHTPLRRDGRDTLPLVGLYLLRAAWDPAPSGGSQVGWTPSPSGGSQVGWTPSHQEDPR